YGEITRCALATCTSPNAETDNLLHQRTPQFFFSSRRRHTRSKRDWSSDVCSSDLPLPDRPPRGRRPRHRRTRGPRRRTPCGADRSEERRVGKECRSRWPPEHEKKEEHQTPERTTSANNSHHTGHRPTRTSLCGGPI